jgi:hypothetical protein
MAFRRRAPKEPTPPVIEPLSISESQWRGQQLEAARRLAERYCETSEMPPSPASLDAVVTAWFDDRAADRADVNDLVNAVGIAFGHHLVSATDLSWVLATDEQGSEIALHRAEGDVLIYPTNLVAKRIVDDARDFLVPTYQQLLERLRPTQA